MDKWNKSQIQNTVCEVMETMSRRPSLMGDFLLREHLELDTRLLLTNLGDRLNINLVDLHYDILRPNLDCTVSDLIAAVTDIMKLEGRYSETFEAKVAKPVQQPGDKQWLAHI